MAGVQGFRIGGKVAMPAYRDARDGRWRFRKKLKLTDGRLARISGTPPINTKAAAEAEERRSIGRVLGPSGQNKEVPTFAEFSETFMELHAIHNKPSEQYTKKLILAKYLVPEFGHVLLDGINKTRIQRFVARLLKTALVPKSVNNVLIILAKMLRWAEETELARGLPRIRLLKVAPSAYDFLNDDDYQRLRDASQSEPMMFAAILAAADAGLRRGEIVALEWGDVSLASQNLVVRRAEWQGIIGGPKGGRERVVPLTNRLTRAMSDIRGISGRVFKGPDGRDLTWHAARRMIIRACKLSGIRRIGWHALRHTFCSRLAMAGCPPQTIQELAGHTDLKTTQRYMHLSPGTLERAVGLLERANIVPTDIRSGDKTKE